MKNLYTIIIGTGYGEDSITAISDIIGCFGIYWNYINSVQSLNSKIYVEVIENYTGMNIDITKGGLSNLTYVEKGKGRIEVSKNHEYMIDRVNSMKRKTGLTDDVPQFESDLS